MYLLGREERMSPGREKTGAEEKKIKDFLKFQMRPKYHYLTNKL